MNEQKNSEQIKKQFEMEYTLNLAVKLPFPESLKQAMEAVKWSNEALAENIGVSSDTIKRYKNKGCLPTKQMAVALCIALKLEYEQSVLFLKGMGMAVSTDRKEEYAYRELLRKHRGKTVDNCNKILESMGIERQFRLYPRSNSKQ